MELFDRCLDLIRTFRSKSSRYSHQGLWRYTSHRCFHWSAVTLYWQILAQEAQRDRGQLWPTFSVWMPKTWSDWRFTSRRGCASSLLWGPAPGGANVPLLMGNWAKPEQFPLQFKVPAFRLRRPFSADLPRLTLPAEAGEAPWSTRFLKDSLVRGLCWAGPLLGGPQLQVRPWPAWAEAGLSGKGGPQKARGHRGQGHPSHSADGLGGSQGGCQGSCQGAPRAWTSCTEAHDASGEAEGQGPPA